jgi:outer membrane protein assembly factor BamB
MSHHRYGWSITLLIIFALSITLFSTDLLAKKRTKAERQAIEAQLLWSHTFPGPLMRLEMTPSALLHAVARDAKSKKSPRTRYLLDESGKLFWQGKETTTALIADSPNAIIMEVISPGLVLHSINRSGAKVWSHPLGGIPASTLSIPESNELVMVMMPYEWPLATGKSYPAHMIRIDLKTGKERWTRPIGNLQGALDAFGGELAVNGGNIWWAAGGRGACVEAKSGKLRWASDLNLKKGSGSSWIFGTGGAAVMRGNGVAFFSPDMGVMWQRVFTKAEYPNGIAWSNGGIIASLASKKELFLTVLDIATGEPRWQTSVKHKSKKYGLPPRGVAVLGNVVAKPANRHLVGFDLATGAELYRTKINKNFFLSIDMIRQINDKLVLVGYQGAIAYSISNGTEIWSQIGYIDPIMEVRKLKQAAMQVALSNFHGSAPGSKRAWKEYSDGSRSYTSAAQTAAFEQQMYSQQQSAKSAKAAKGLSTLGETEQQVVNRRLGPDYAEFYRHRGSSLMLLKVVNELDGALIDLRSGLTREAGGRRATEGCIAQIMIDPINNKMVQVYRKMGLWCKDVNKIEMYPFKK